MKMASILKYGIILFLLYHLVLSHPGTVHGKKQLLYILIDGFRYDYVDRQNPEYLPGFTKFLNEGVRAKWMTAIFPTNSYPDWTTLTTGLYPESHGIVGNYIYDHEEHDAFSLFDADATGKSKWWVDAEPIWSTSTKAGRSTGVILWSRCDIPFDGVTPDYCEPFTKITGPEIFRINIDKAIKKLEENFDFVMVYNEHTDFTGHLFGPESKEVDKAVRELDETILHLLERLEALKLTVNIIIVSDHGMMTSGPHRVELDEYLPLEYIEKIVDSGATSNIKVLPNHVEDVYENAKMIPGVEAFKHDEIPSHYNYKNHKFIHDILLKADPDTVIMGSKSTKMLPPRTSDFYSLGIHGYDPNLEKMRAIFFAKGPDFKKDTTIDPIRNVDVYPLLAHLLQVTPNPHNGSLSATSQALAMEQEHSSSTSVSHHLMLVLTCSFIYILNLLL